MTDLEVRHLLAVALHHYYPVVYEPACPVNG